MFEAMEFYVCENIDACSKLECLMMIPRKVSKPVSNCDDFGCNVLDMTIDADKARKILFEKYPELLGNEIPGTIQHT